MLVVYVYIPYILIYTRFLGNFVHSHYKRINTYMFPYRPDYIITPVSRGHGASRSLDLYGIQPSLGGDSLVVEPSKESPPKLGC